MATLNWFIDEDHFAAQTEYGTYTVGDWGSGNAFVNLPGVGHEIVPFATGKDVAQADYDKRTSEEVVPGEPTLDSEAVEKDTVANTFGTEVVTQ